jgi:predicted MarR family transcription regulator
MPHKTEAAPDEDAPFAPSAQSERVSHLEYNLLTLMFGFSRWVETCMAAGNVHGLGALDILVLHMVNHRARGRRLSDICMVLNIDDSHLISYALKKLAAAKLIQAERRGRERHFSTTETGDRACLAYRRARETFLVDPFFAEPATTAGMETAAKFMSQMTAVYDQAGRNATVSTLNRPKLPPVRTKR